MADNKHKCNQTNDIEKRSCVLKQIGWGLAAALAVSALVFIVFKSNVLPTKPREKDLASYRVDWREIVPDISMNLNRIDGKNCTVTDWRIASVFPYADRYQMRHFDRIKITVRGIGNCGGQSVALVYSAVIKIKIVPAELLSAQTLSVEQTEFDVFDDKGAKINVDVFDVKDMMTARLQDMRIQFKSHPGVTADCLVDDEVWVRTDAVEFFQWRRQ